MKNISHFDIYQIYLYNSTQKKDYLLYVYIVHVYNNFLKDNLKMDLYDQGHEQYLHQSKIKLILRKIQDETSIIGIVVISIFLILLVIALIGAIILLIGKFCVLIRNILKVMYCWLEKCDKNKSFDYQNIV